MKKLFTLLFFLGVPLWATTTPLLERFEVSWAVGGELQLGSSVNVSVTISPIIPSTNAMLETHLSSGLSFVSGPLLYSGPITQETTFVFGVRVDSLGRHDLWIELEAFDPEPGYANMILRDLYLQVEDDTVSFWSAELPEGFKTICTEEEVEIPEDSSRGPFTISGYVYWYNKETNSYEPLGGVLVQVRAHLVPFGVSVRGENVSDENGYYSISGTTPPWFVNFYELAVMAKNEATSVRDPQIWPKPYPIYDIYSKVIDLKEPWIEINVKEYWYPVVRVLQNLKFIRRWTNQNLYNGDVLPIPVHFFWGQRGSSYTNSGFSKWINIGEYDISGGGVAYGQYTCAHEFGHYYMNHVAGNWDPMMMHDPHKLCSYFNKIHAFVEGWAEFMGTMVWSDCDSAYYIGTHRNPTAEFYYANKGRPFWVGCDGNNGAGRGDIVEGTVFQILWDLFDGPNTPDNTPGFDDEGFDGNSYNSKSGLWAKFWTISLHQVGL